jgi:hypothetical protein
MTLSTLTPLTALPPAPVPKRSAWLLIATALPAGVAEVLITPVVDPPVVKTGALFNIALLSVNPDTKRDIFSP